MTFFGPQQEEKIAPAGGSGRGLAPIIDGVEWLVGAGAKGQEGGEGGNSKKADPAHASQPEQSTCPLKVAGPHRRRSPKLPDYTGDPGASWRPHEPAKAA